MPETPEEMYTRVHDSLRMPPVHEWDSFPFDGEMAPRALRPPTEEEIPRRGAGGVDCPTCAAPDDLYLWHNERWRVHSMEKPTGLPMMLFLEPRAHVGEPGELSDAMAAELGVLIARIERAVRGLGEIGRVFVCRWGDGTEHLHWWFIARPARMPQLIGSFATIWDDVLPPVPEETWRADLEAVRRELNG